MQFATTSRFAVKLEALPRTGSCHHLSPVSLSRALVFDAQQGFIPTTDPMDLLYSTSMGGAGLYYQSGSEVTFCLPQI